VSVVKLFGKEGTYCPAAALPKAWSLEGSNCFVDIVITVLGRKSGERSS
jgi:hypothetical protein